MDGTRGAFTTSQHHSDTTIHIVNENQYQLHLARRAVILDAAQRLFAARGFAAATLDEVAELADLTPTEIERQFESKEALLRELIRERVIASADARTSTTGPSPAKQVLREHASSLWASAADPRLVTMRRLSIGEMAQFPELALLHATEIDVRAVLATEKLIEQGTVTGEFRPVDARAVARILVAALAMQAFWWAHPELYSSVTGRDEASIRDLTVDCVLQAIMPDTTR